MITPGAINPGTINPDRVLIVGGGLAAFHTARSLRSKGFGGDLTVLGAESYAAYDRPPLSKSYLTGMITVDDLALDDPDDPVQARWVRGACAAALDVGTRTVHTTDGRSFTADAIVIATGADAVRLGPPLPGTHVLRTLDDAESLRADGVAGRRVAVVGGGFVALEAAAAAVALGARTVTVLAPEDEPLRHRFGEVVAGALRSLHEGHGVTFRCGSRARGYVAGPDGRVAGVALADGVVVPADLVVAGVGAVPATGWLRTCDVPLDPTGAVHCDRSGFTGLQGIWAVGDCAGGDRRSGHWQDAVDQADAVAAAVLGLEPVGSPVPYCWSDQYGITIQVAGVPTGDEQVSVRAGSSADGDLFVAYLRAGEEVAVLGMNRLREVTRWRRARRSTAQPAQEVAA